MTDAPVPGFYGDIYAGLRKAGVEMFCYVPDEALGPLIDSAGADADVRSIMLTTEEEGVALCCGAALGGQRAVLMMQSSGVGNCVNAFTLVENCRFPFLALVAMRGEFGETNAWQVPMGRITGDVLELARFHVWWAHRPDEVATMIDNAANMVWRGNQPVAILLSQQLVGAKDM
jgi:sulfopyruvate decarboxylase alpha subunit